MHRQEDLREIRERLGLPSRFVFYPAQTWPHKNHLKLIEAIAELRRQGLVVNLVCSGTRNEHYARIGKRVAELNLGGQVWFVDYVTPTELRCLYRLARGVVIPSKFEAGSFPLWEAFHSRTPAACSNVTSLPLQAGDAALLFDPDDVQAMAQAVFQLWTDDAVCARLVRLGERQVQLFTWSRTARHFRALYRQVAGIVLNDEDRQLLSADPLM